MSEEEKYFAFIEHDGRIELVFWCKSERDARKKIAEWKRDDKKHGDTDPDIHYFVGEILFPKKQRA
jgi:hypothetical protein